MTEFMNGRVVVKVGDITAEDVNAIVNAANSSLMGGGGVDGAIHRAGGAEIVDECKIARKEQYPGGLPTGKAIATTAGKLKARYVIHTVGPVWHGGTKNEEKLLGDCYTNSLNIASDNGCKTVAFPAISTGVYGFPKKLAAKVSSNAIRDFLENNKSIQKVVFVFFSAGDAEIFIAENEF